MYIGENEITSGVLVVRMNEVGSVVFPFGKYDLVFDPTILDGTVLCDYDSKQIKIPSDVPGLAFTFGFLNNLQPYRVNFSFMCFGSNPDGHRTINYSYFRVPTENLTSK